MYRKTYLKIDLDAVKFNVKNAMEFVGGPQLLAVVKSDAYGHGCVEVARAAVSAGASFLAVALAEEAIPIRKAGIDTPVLILGISNEAQMRLAGGLHLDVCVAGLNDVKRASSVASETGTRLKLHVKLDTGMGRIGFRNMDEFKKACDLIAEGGNLEFAGLFTHLACADMKDTEYSLKQKSAFETYRKAAYDAGFRPVCHIANSAALMSDDRTFFYDMVRYGISLYGYYASAEVTRRNVVLRPVMSAYSEIVYVKEIDDGECVSYGATYKARGKRTIATVPVGYGDGYNRLLSNKGRMIVVSGGKSYYAPIAGRVCMDQTMIDVTGIPGVHEGTNVIMLGESGGLRIDADEIADICGTISYEVLLDFTSRMPRIYE